MKRILVLMTGCILFMNVRAQTVVSAQQRWTDSVYNSLTQAERIGQLFMVAAFTIKEPEHFAEVERLITEHKIGGLIFFKGGPIGQAKLTNRYQSLSKVPLFIGIDGEWGLSMRLDSTIAYPYQLALGSVQNDSLVYRMGLEIARQCRRMGIHINFAPCVDINNNPANPVINYRSFGENKYRVAQLGYMYMKGLQDGHVMACAKHFPGHGDTETDSHLDLPVINASMQRMDTLELFPYRYLFDRGLKSAMVAHLFIPAIDSTPNMAASISPKAVDTLLRQKLGFNGLIFTDALNMRGVAKFYAPGEVDVKALIAGNDVLLYSENVPVAISRIKRALDSNWISQEVFERKVKLILAEKYWAGLNRPQFVDTTNLYNDLNSPAAKQILRELIRDEICLVDNHDKLVPVNYSSSKRVATVAIGSTGRNTFQEVLSYHGRFDEFNIDKAASKGAFDSLLMKLHDYKVVIVSLHNTSKMVTRSYGLTEGAIYFINKVNKKHRILFVNFGNPYSLVSFPGIRNLVIAFEDNPNTQLEAAQMICGANSANGKLSVTATAEYPFNKGELISPKGNMKRAMPSELGLSEKKLSLIDSIVMQAIADSATPGCQVLVAKDNKIFYQKSFGRFTYDTASARVQNSDLYDLASITKVAATTLAVMKLYEDKKIRLDDRVSKYVKELRKSNKKNITIREMLLHESGLQAFIPFYRYTVSDSVKRSRYYSRIRSEKFPVEVAPGMYLKKNYDDTIWMQIIKSDLKKKGEYLYSDLNFIILQRMVESITGHKLEQYLEDHFYAPMGLSTMRYKPLQKIDSNRIVPTENDTFFRRQVVRGFVHDQAAAMLGGVAGHAGLFSNANDLAILMQMLLNKGVYAGKKYFDTATVELFTGKRSISGRRGLGFDKPELDPGKASPTSSLASPLCFGHTGFTGTCVWVDPQFNLIYIFLSNRVYPSTENKKLIQMNVRTDVQEIIYESLISLPVGNGQ